jgi:hypothetical protein
MSRARPGTRPAGAAEEETMTDTGEAPARARTAYTEETSAAWFAWVVFAGIIMIMIGSFHALAGFVALFEDEYYVTTSSGLVVDVDYTAWGWTHLILGTVLALAGIALFAGQMWARILAVIVAGLSAFANMVFMAAYPLWSIIIITMDVVVIYAVVVHGRAGRTLTGR